MWLRVRQGQLYRALPALMRALRREKWVMIESNSILGHINPALYLFVLDPYQNDFKTSALKYLMRVDALIRIGREGGNASWPGVDADLLSSKPAFNLTRPNELSNELIDFVRQNLGLEKTTK